MRWLFGGFLLLSPALLTSCSSLLDPRVCTQIGCADGIGVELIGLPAGPYTLELVLPSGEVHIVECPDSAQCPPAFVEGIRADEVVLRLTSAEGTQVETMNPVYTRHQPNGRGCPPICWQALVTMQVSLS
jgi:hypothetical protein